jgi:xanthine dehydrogenase small subunit
VCAASPCGIEQGVVARRASPSAAWRHPARAPRRARAAGAALECGEHRAAIGAGRGLQPLTDLRASSAYRLQAAGNLLRRFYLEHGGTHWRDAAPCGRRRRGAARR